MGPAIAWFIAFSFIQSPAPPQPDVSLVLHCGGQSGELALSIHNSGETDTAILLGIALANGRWYFPRELVLEVRRSGNAEVEDRAFFGPRGIAGRIDHWVVPLPVQSTFMLPLRPGDFFATRTAPPISPVDELRVRLTGRPITSDLNMDMVGIKSWRVWTGNATSNPLPVSVCSR
jgi:hypothetical protein